MAMAKESETFIQIGKCAKAKEKRSQHSHLGNMLEKCYK